MIEGIKNNLRQLISDAQLIRAFSTLEAYLDHSSEKINTILLLRSRINLLETEKSRNIITQEQAKVEFSKISWSLIEIVDNLKAKDLLLNSQLNQDYDENWGIVEYYAETTISQKEYLICLQKIDSVQKQYNSNLQKIKNTLDNLQNENKSDLTRLKLRNATIEFAKDIHTYIDGFTKEINQFDALTIRTTYSLLKTLEFMMLYNDKIDIKILKKLLYFYKNIQKSIGSLEKSLKQSKAMYSRGFSFGKELNIASRRAASQHSMFISKCKSCVMLLETYHENLTILIIEYRLKNSYFYKLLVFLGLKKNLKNRYSASLNLA